jgi:transcription initiation factor TFIID subunit 1
LFIFFCLEGHQWLLYGALTLLHAEFRPSEKIKLFGSGKELQDDISLAMQNVRPNSILHVVRTEVHLWPKAQRLPGKDKALRPPGAFRKRADLSVKDGHVFLME